MHTILPFLRVTPISLAALLVVAAPAVAEETLTAAPAGTEPVETDPVVLHAQALLAESDGDVDGALAELRRANGLASGKDASIAFDLARLAKRAGSAQASDYDALLASAPETAAAATLKALIEAERGDKDAATRTIEAYNTTQVRTRAPSGGTSEAPRKWWGVRARLASQYDSNVAVLDEDSEQSATRLALNAALTARPFDKQDIAFSLAFSMGPSLTNRTQQIVGVDLSQLDASSIALSAAAGKKLGKLRLGGVVTGSQVFLNLASDRFSQDAIVGVDGMYNFGGVEAGLFANVGYRDFVDAPPGRGLNRDGKVVNGGARARLSIDKLYVVAQGGYLLEGQSKNQEQRGPAFGGTVGYDLKSLRLNAGVVYEMRDFWRSAIPSQGDPDVTNKRLDRRTTGVANASINVMTGIDLIAGYTYIRNDTLTQFDYTRHLATAGVEGRW